MEGEGRTRNLLPLHPVLSSSSSSMTHYPALPPALLPLGLLLSQELLDTRIRAHLLCQAPAKVSGAEHCEAKGREKSVLVLCSLLSQLLSQSPCAAVVHPTLLSQETIPESLPLGHSAVLPSTLTCLSPLVSPLQAPLFPAVPRLGEETLLLFKREFLKSAGLEGTVNLKGKSTPASHVYRA